MLHEAGEFLETDKQNQLEISEPASNQNVRVFFQTGQIQILSFWQLLFSKVQPFKSYLMPL